MLNQEKRKVFAEIKDEYFLSNNSFDEAIKLASTIDIDDTTLATILCISEASLFQYRNRGIEFSLSNKSSNLIHLFIDVHTYLHSISNGDRAFVKQWLKMENDYLGDAPILLMRNPNGITKILDYLKSRSLSVIDKSVT